MSLPYAMAVTLSRSALAISLPAGSAISAAFAFQQYRAKGASRTIATAVMVLSGIMSFAGLAVLYLIGGAFYGVISLCVLVGTAVLAGTALVVVWRGWRPQPDGRLGQIVAAAHEVAARHWALALVFAIVNWFADLLCLLAVIRAFDLTLPVSAVAGTYLAVQIVRQVPLTPGGIGVIETGLLTGLVSAGASNASAAAAVLGYRVLSCWLIIPIGLVTWAALRRPARNAPAAGLSPRKAAGYRRCRTAKPTELIHEGTAHRRTRLHSRVSRAEVLRMRLTMCEHRVGEHRRPGRVEDQPGLVAAVVEPAGFGRDARPLVRRHRAADAVGLGDRRTQQVEQKPRGSDRQQ
jgi:putative heme transporter